MTSQLEHSCRHEPGWMGKRALDSRCGESDGWPAGATHEDEIPYFHHHDRVGLPDSHCGSNNGYQVTSSYLPLHGPERGHRNADNEKTLCESGHRLDNVPKMAFIIDNALKRRELCRFCNLTSHSCCLNLSAPLATFQPSWTTWRCNKISSTSMAPRVRFI